MKQVQLVSNSYVLFLIVTTSSIIVGYWTAFFTLLFGLRDWQLLGIHWERVIVELGWKSRSWGTVCKSTVSECMLLDVNLIFSALMLSNTLTSMFGLLMLNKLLCPILYKSVFSQPFNTLWANHVLQKMHSISEIVFCFYCSYHINNPPLLKLKPSTVNRLKTVL